ncbi:MAG TPA: YceI family protein [Gemmatimonadaceae bacterium]|nr:YceI family protein [Gemmatimonadaceae bacterium]
MGITENEMQTKKTAAVVLPVLATLFAAGCRGGEAGEARAATVAQTSVRAPALPRTDGVQLVVAPDGNEVRYRVREQLVGVDLPNDAIGATKEVTGGISFDAKGNIVPASSKFRVNVGTLKSDKDRRDGYIRGRVLETTKFPTVELAPKAIKGLTQPLPTTGSKTFQVVGDLTVHGVTKPTTWQVEATFNGTRVSGTATTMFPFSEFGLTQPRVPIVLSVADTIKLEYTFSLVPKS